MMNNYLRFLLIWCISFFLIHDLSAQVSGISASKLMTYNATSVSRGMLEFEPSFFICRSDAYLDMDRNKIEKYPGSDSVELGMESGFRITYGLTGRIEAGFSIPFNSNGFSLGTKFLLMDQNGLQMAGILGFNSGAYDGIVCKKHNHYMNAPSVSGGLVFTVVFTDQFSVDFDSQLQLATKATKEEHLSDYFINMDAGYYVLPGIQSVIGVNYYASTFKDSNYDSDQICLNLGMTIETAGNFIMVINTPIPITGKNVDYRNGFGFALTILLD